MYIVLAIVVLAAVIAVLLLLRANPYKSGQESSEIGSLDLTDCDGNSQRGSTDRLAHPYEITNQIPIDGSSRATLSGHDYFAPKPGTTRQRKTKKPPFEIPAIFTIVDLETTGFSAGMDEIIEIGAIRYCCDSKEATEFSTLVKPNNPIPPLISEITGITQEMVDNDGVPLSLGIQKLSGFLAGLSFIGYQTDFDARFLRSAADQHGIELTSSYLDVLEMVREAYPALPSHKLSDVATMLNLSNEHAHRAISDCRRTLAVFLHVRPLVKAQYVWKPLSSLPIADRNQNHSSSYDYFLNHTHAHFAPREGEATGHMRGQTVVFTGDFSMPKEKAADLAATAGCNVAANVTWKTTILVAGQREPSQFNGKLKSGKLLKAEELISQGRAIRILNEDEFFRLVYRR